MKKLLAFMFITLLLSCGNRGASLKLNKEVYAPGEEIRVEFTASGSYVSDAWIGIVPSDVPHGDEAVNDRYDISYRYINKRTSGTFTFTAPSQPGTYDIRMHDTDNNGKEVAYVTFRVRAENTPTLRIDRNEFKPGETIVVEFTAPATYDRTAWIGIVPSDVPHGDEVVNDRYDIVYEYLNGNTSGTVKFTAPEKPGTYDIRMHDTDSDGKEVGYVTFKVVE